MREEYLIIENKHRPRGKSVLSVQETARSVWLEQHGKSFEEWAGRHSRDLTGHFENLIFILRRWGVIEMLSGGMQDRAPSGCFVESRTQEAKGKSRESSLEAVGAFQVRMMGAWTKSSCWRWREIALRF